MRLLWFLSLEYLHLNERNFEINVLHHFNVIHFFPALSHPEFNHIVPNSWLHEKVKCRQGFPFMIIVENIFAYLECILMNWM